MSANKVRFGLKNAHYAVIATSGSSAGTHGTPVAIPGAVSLSLSQEGENVNFYADNSKYYVTVLNNGYSGSLEVAKIPDSMLKDVFGQTEGTTSKVLTESTSAEPAHFALLFEIDGDADDELYVMYECVASRPNIESATKEDGVDVKTQSIDITCIPFGAGNKVMAHTTADTPAQTKTSWFTTVFVEA